MARYQSGSILDFFRHCPHCGKRFHVRQVSREKKRVLGREVKVAPPRIRIYGTSTMVERPGARVTISIEEFLYNYKCKVCGHGWSEKRVEKHVERSVEIEPTI